MKKYLYIYTLILILFVWSVADAQTILFPSRGGTGKGSATPSDVGLCLKVLDDSPFTYEFSTCGTGGTGGGGGTFSTTTVSNYPFLINYPNNATDVVLFGSTSATSSAKYWFDSNFERALIGRTTSASTTISGSVYLPQVSQGLLFIGSNNKVNSIATSSPFTWTGLHTFSNSSTTLASFNYASTTNLVAGTGLVTLLTSHLVKADASDGLLVEANNGTDVAIFGAGNTANSLFYGGVNIDGTTRLATSLTGLLKATAGTVSTAVNGTDYTLVSALTCSAGQHFSQVTAGGTFTCSADTGGVYPFTSPFANSFATTSVALLYGGASTTVQSIFGTLFVGGTSTSTIVGGTATSTISGKLAIGSSTPALLNSFLTIIGQENANIQANIQNKSTGSSASADWDVTANNGTESTYYASFGINNSNGALAPFTTANHGYLYTSDSALNIGSLGTTSSSGFITFNTGGGLSAPNERVRIDNNGLVGIATTSPWALLSINPTSSIGTAPAFAIGSSTATNFIVNNRGYVGIGTTSPSFNFEVNASSTSLGLFKQAIPGATALGVLALIHQNVQQPLSGSIVNANFIAANELSFSTTPGTYIALGLNGLCTVKGTDGTTWGASSQCTGGAFAGNYNGTGALPTLFGISALVKRDGTGNVTSKMYSITTSNDQGTSATSGTITEAGGITISRPSGTAGMTFTNIYGIRIANQTPSAGTRTNTPYGLAQDGTGDLNYFLGNLGVGTTSPFKPLSVQGEVAFAGVVNGAGTAYLCHTIATGIVSTSTTACNPSSRKYKENIESLNYGLSEVLKLKPVSFDYKPEMKIKGHQVGFIAEEMYKVIPEVVGMKDGKPDNIDYAKLTSVLTKAIQELAVAKGIKRSAEENYQWLVIALLVLWIIRLEIKLKK